MSPVSLVLCTTITWVDLKDRIGQRSPVYRMRCPCFITQVYFSPASFPATKHKQISRHLLIIAQLCKTILLRKYLKWIEVFNIPDRSHWSSSTLKRWTNLGALVAFPVHPLHRLNLGVIYLPWQIEHFGSNIKGPKNIIEIWQQCSHLCYRELL